jgi:hypothetical protein
MKAESSDTREYFWGVRKLEKINQNFFKFNLENEKQTTYLCIRFRKQREQKQEKSSSERTFLDQEKTVRF